MVRRTLLILAIGLTAVVALAIFFRASAQEAQPVFTWQEVMIPVRDGVHLQTVILRPVGQQHPLPILFRRTPYGVPEKAPEHMPASWKELAADGYIFVIQNLRGRFKSEGNFALSSQVSLSDPKATSETTDAYDSIEWLLKNVPDNNGKVGMYGVSYDGLTTGLALLHPHPALKAVSEQASPVDQWMNDDMHRYGALRESYAVEYAVMEQADKNANVHFDFETYDTYQWYLNLGPLSNINAKYLHGKIPFWNSTVEHPNYDEFWKKEAWVRQLHASTVPNLNVAGFWDQEDPWGPWQIFQHAAEHDPEHTNFIVAGPWFHGEWQTAKGDSIGQIPFGGHETAREFRENIEAPFFRYYLHGQGEKPNWQATTFQSGSNSWHTYAAWPPKEAKATNLYLHADGTLSFSAPGPAEKHPYREYVSDPANPVPYRQRPISPTYPGGDWRTWEVADQRFVDGRPDVLTFVSAPLDHDLTVTGPLAATLFASTSGTDSDFVVKLIDVFPENAQKNEWDAGAGPKPGEYAKSLNGYELPIAMEVRRGRYLQSDEQPHPLPSNQVIEWSVPLRDHDHVFLKGHRLMVQIQSTWFPVIDRNPQKFVPSIYQAKAEDFAPATQRIYCTASKASHVTLPVVP
jgi:putative CocE/NonD family hydrolase